MAEKQTVILAAGGTGGHIFPAAALAEVLLARGYEVRLVTDRRFHGYNHTGVLKEIPVHTIHAGNISGNPMKKLLGMAAILLGTMQAAWLLRRRRPLAVVGFGGYPSLPTMLAALLVGARSIIHEQNSVLGRVNRLIASRVDIIATSYPHTLKMPHPAPHTVQTGNPVRAAVSSLIHTPYSAPEDHGALRLLVLGGSQGASIFSDVLPAAMVLLPPELRARIHLAQQVRKTELSAVEEKYEALGMNVEIAPFFTDVAGRMAQAHLIISRAGASSVAELMLLGRPAMLVPLPGAMDNHQFYNAQAVEQAGAGWVVLQPDFAPQYLAETLKTLLRQPAKLSQYAAAMQALAVPGAAEALADITVAPRENAGR